MRRDCNEGTALNMAAVTISGGFTERKQVFLIWTVCLIHLTECYARVGPSVEVTDDDCNEV